MADKDQEAFAKQQAARDKAVAKIVHDRHAKQDEADSKGGKK